MAIRRRDIQWLHQLSALGDRILRAVSRHPFLTCCTIGFLSGSLLDLDHLPQWFFHIKYWVPVFIHGAHNLGQGRNLHGLALLGGGLMCAYAGGSLLLMVLKGTILRESPMRPEKTQSLVSHKELKGHKEPDDFS